MSLVNVHALIRRATRNRMFGVEAISMAVARSTSAFKVCWTPEVSVVKYCISVILYTKYCISVILYAKKKYYAPKCIYVISVSNPVPAQ